MNQTPYSYMPPNLHPLHNTMMNNPSVSMDGQWNQHHQEIDAKFNRIERQIKRLEQRINHLEQEKIIPLSSKANIYPNQAQTDGMYMM